jgi:hypothetical protein
LLVSLGINEDFVMATKFSRDLFLISNQKITWFVKMLLNKRF